VDFAIALALMITLVIATAGLGVIALLEIPAAALVIASVGFERRRGRKAAISAANRPHRR
jgi:hypothetical protein